MIRLGDAGAVTQRLVDWASEVLPGLSVSAVSASAAAPVQGIAVRLVGLAQRAVPAVAGMRSAALALDYRIAAGLDDPVAEHRALSDLAFAAIVSDDFEFVAADAAGLMLRGEARRDLVQPSAPLVRHPPIASLEPLARAEGQVLGPEGQPIANALVTIAGSNRSAMTGRDGRFRFAIPAGQPARITARARSHEVTASLEPDAITNLTLPMEA